jgi:DNA-binding NarL/FixJ family response regulator
MLIGVHVYARAKVVPDLAISRGEDAHRAAKLAGDQATEFSAAGGVALTHLELGDIDEAERWLEIAGPVAASAPTPLRTRQLELSRGRVRAGAGDGEGMRRHFDQARLLANRAGVAARAEVGAWHALTAARLGARTNDQQLLADAEEAAGQAKALADALSGHSPWGAYAAAALAEIALARGDAEAAAGAGGAALQAFQDAMTEDVHIEALLSAARGILAGAPPEYQGPLLSWLKLTLSRIAQATLDDTVRVRWLRGPLGKELVELAGGLDVDGVRTEAAASAPGASGSVADLDDIDRQIAHLLTEGHTNREMASKLDLSEPDVAARLSRVLAGLGASSRAEATSLAFRGLTPASSLAGARG